MNQLPEEIIEQILCKCDAITVVRCLSISRTFNSAACRILGNREYWKAKFLKDVPPEIFQDIIGAKSLPYLKDLYYQDHANEFNPWFKSYQTWYCSRALSDFCANVRVPKPDCDRVNVLQVSGDLIILGQTDGKVLICDYMSSEVQLACQHYSRIKDIALINLTSRESFSIFDSDVGSLSHHHHIVSISDDSTIKIYPMKALIHQPKMAVFRSRPCVRKLDFVRVFDDKCAFYTHNCQILIWKLTLPIKGPEDVDDPMSAEPIQTITAPDESPGWMGFWSNKIYTVCGENLKHSIYNLKDGSWEQTSLPILPASLSTLKMPSSLRSPMTLSDVLRQNLNIKNFQNSTPTESLKIVKGYVIRDGIVFLITVTQTVLYSVDFCNFHKIPADWFNSRVTAITMSGSFLAFGLENGQVIMYSVLSKEELLDFTKLKPKWKRIPRNESSVINLSISFHRRGPLLTVVTENSLYLYKWFIGKNSDLFTAY